MSAVGIFAALLFGSGFAEAQPCYKQSVVPGYLDCQGGGGNSADFNSNCTYVPQKVVQVPVSCPASSGGGGGGGSENGGDGMGGRGNNGNL